MCSWQDILGRSDCCPQASEFHLVRKLKLKRGHKLPDLPKLFDRLNNSLNMHASTDSHCCYSSTLTSSTTPIPYQSPCIIDMAGMSLTPN